MNRFKKCDKPDCFRLVHEGTLYCCGSCRMADECVNKFELSDDPTAHPLLRHSESCNERATQRAGLKVGDYETLR